MKFPHKHFFSSLKQVEKRIKLDDQNPPPPPPPQTETQPTESSYSSPIYFLNQHTNTSSTLHDEHPPHEFLSNPNTNPQLNNPENNLSQNETVGDIGTMIQLLGLSEFDGRVTDMMPEVADEEFYEKIVKVKGPKCKKEMERLDGWIDYLVRNGREPLRLAHLLMAKAAVVAVAGSGGGDGYVFEFPVTVDEFLQNDPPSD